LRQNECPLKTTKNISKYALPVNRRVQFPLNNPDVLSIPLPVTIGNIKPLNTMFRQEQKPPHYSLVFFPDSTCESPGLDDHSCLIFPGVILISIHCMN
jgi:hypothetical protein